MSNKKSACDTANATSTKNNKPDSIISSATEKIKLCNKKNLKDHKSKAILEPVKKMLCEFSEQNEEFARAVTAAENLENLIDEVGKKLPAAVSDLDVYQQIVGKIFPGAKVTFTMQIHMSEYELEGPNVAEQKEEYEERLKNVQTADGSSDDKDVFKAYFSIAYDSFIRMLDFAKRSQDKEFFKGKVEHLIEALATQNINL